MLLFCMGFLSGGDSCCQSFAVLLYDVLDEVCPFLGTIGELWTRVVLVLQVLLNQMPVGLNIFYFKRKLIVRGKNAT